MIQKTDDELYKIHLNLWSKTKDSANCAFAMYRSAEAEAIKEISSLQSVIDQQAGKIGELEGFIQRTRMAKEINNEDMSIQSKHQAMVQELEAVEKYNAKWKEEETISFTNSTNGYWIKASEAKAIIEKFK